MEQKDVEYFRLRELHEEIIATGLPLSVKTGKSRGAIKISIEYVGKSEYELFYSFEHLVYSLVLDIFQAHRSRFRIPLPFAPSKLSQKSGARVIDRATNKDVVRARLQRNVATFDISAEHGHSVHSLLLEQIGRVGHWRASICEET